MTGLPSDEYYAEKMKAEFKSDPADAFWTFTSFHWQMDGAFHGRIGSARKHIEQIEVSVHAEQPAFEEMIGKLYTADPKTSQGRMLQYSDSLYDVALEAMADVLLHN